MTYSCVFQKACFRVDVNRAISSRLRSLALRNGKTEQLENDTDNFSQLNTDFPSRKKSIVQMRRLSKRACPYSFHLIIACLLLILGPERSVRLVSLITEKSMQIDLPYGLPSSPDLKIADGLHFFFILLAVIWLRVELKRSFRLLSSLDGVI
jgi:hypothetical protein